LPEAEQGPSSPKLAPGLVIQGIHLMRTRGNQMEPGSLEAAGKSVNVVNPELDLDFTVGRHAASIKKR
jgi:acyl-CoA reductase-like NAD-dependent aldehyde dehydrogenase